MTAKRRVWLYPGNRSDVLVQAPERKGNYFLCTFQEDETAPPGQAKTVLKRLARLVVGGSPKPMGLPKESRLAICKPYVSIETSECTAKRNLVLEFDYEKRVFHIAGESFSKQSRTDTAQLGSTEEWTLTSTAPEGDQPDEPHPFHMHVNPFQVIQIEDLETGQVKKIDEWRDTMVVEKGKKITIRIRFRDFAGKTVYHCHAVDHEDQGMMRVLRIVDPKAPEQPTDGELTECKTPLPQSKLGASLEQSRMTVVVFFRGMGCAHCRQELRRLLAEAATIASDATIVAVSSEPISDVDRVIKSLEVPSGVQFRLVVDQDRQFFRDFGCYEQGPQHGLFIIDKENLLRAQFVGEVPFAKPAEVVEVVRKLSR
jgi:peroxiredoxin